MRRLTVQLQRQIQLKPWLPTSIILRRRRHKNTSNKPDQTVNPPLKRQKHEASDACCQGLFNLKNGLAVFYLPIFKSLHFLSENNP
jgi:hypothetical protein